MNGDGDARRLLRTAGAAACLLAWSALSGADAQEPVADRWDALAPPLFRVVADRSSSFQGLLRTELPLAVAQDATGFLWVATEAGLERWDGNELRMYGTHRGEPCALQAEDLTVLMIDDRQRLWTRSLDGIARYDPETDCFHDIKLWTSGSAGNYVTALAGDGAGGVWVGTTMGLEHLDPDLRHVTHVDTNSAGAAPRAPVTVLRILRDRDGALWVGSDDGLRRRGAGQTAFSDVPLPPVAGSRQPVRALLQSSDGRIWVGTGAGRAYIVDPLSLGVSELAALRQFEDLSAVWDAAEAANGEVWLATHGSGIVVVDPRSLRIRRLLHQKGVPTSLLQNSVEALYRDRGGLMWAVCFRGFGYYMLNPATAAILTVDAGHGLPDGPVNSMVRLEDDRIALGSQRQIVLIGPDSAAAEPIPLEPGLSVDGVFALATPDGRDLFAGIRPLGLLWIDRSRGKTYRIPLPGTQTVQRIYSLAMEGERLWVGGRDGVWSVVRDSTGGATAAPWRSERQFDVPRVFAIAVAADGTKWFGGPNGLVRLNPAGDNPAHMQWMDEHGEPMFDPFVLAIQVDRHDRLWAGSTTRGSFLLDPSTGPGDRVRVRRRFPYNASAILEGKDGTVWISTDDGVARIDPVSLETRLVGRGDGIVEQNFWNGSAAATAHGELLFGGEGGIALLRPQRIGSTRHPAPLLITGIAVGSRSVAVGPYNRPGTEPVIDVPADAQSLSVSFAALDFVAPEMHAYAYRLDGYDRDWIRTRFTNRIAHYTNLAPGTYRLRVQGTDLAGVATGPERQLTVQVAAAWHQTRWFEALEAVGVLLTLVLVVQARTVVLRSRQRELETQVEERTHALVRATEARNSLIENLAHDLRTPLTSLRGYLDRLSVHDEALADTERERFVGIAVRQAERLIRLVRELFELVRLDDPLARLTLERFSPAEVVQDVVQEFASIAADRSVVCEIDRGAESVQIEGDISLFQRLIDNLVDNAVSHTPAGGRVTVRLGTDEARIVLQVSDTGRGIGSADLARIFDRYERGDTTGRRSGAGLGLAIVKRILELQGGSITVDSAVGQGARFTVHLPRTSPAEPDPPS